MTRSLSRIAVERPRGVAMRDERLRMDIADYLSGALLMTPDAAARALDHLTQADLTMIELGMRHGRAVRHLHDYDPFA